MTRLLSVIASLSWLIAVAAAEPAGLDRAHHPGSVRPDKDKFSFLIFSDRTGGHVPGYMERAVHEANQLRPDFIICVGDLIEGYSQDLPAIVRQWEELDGIVAGLDAPFFYVAGNHDYSNPAMEQVFVDRYGTPWYSFDYRGVHFIALLSEQLGPDGQPVHRIQGEQLAWLQRDVAAHRHARHFVIFLHKPLWSSGYHSNWAEVEALFAGLPLTAFAGHEHRYMMEQRGPELRRHFILGPTAARAGNCVLLGTRNHYAQVTVDGDELAVALIDLGSVHAADVVTPESWQALQSARVKVSIAEYDTRSGSGVLVCHNPGSEPAGVQLLWSFDPAVWEMNGAPPSRLDVPPGETVRRPFSFVCRDARRGAQQPPRLEAIVPLGRFGPREDQATEAVSVPHVFALGIPPVRINVDGRFKEWPRPGTPLGGREEPGDCAAGFQLGYSNRGLGLYARVTDERIAATATSSWRGDALELFLDTRPPDNQARDFTQPHSWQLIFSPYFTGAQGAETLSGRRVVPGTVWHLVRHDDGYELEALIPWEGLGLAADTFDQRLRFDLALDDLDDPSSNAREEQVIWMSRQPWADVSLYARSARLP